MNLRQIRAFVGVYEDGSFSRAAERLNATQSGLSMQVQNLEARLGAALFERSTRGVVPTQAGRRFYLRAVEILRHVEDAGAELHTLARGVSGPLRIGLMPTFTRGALAPALEGFLRDHPHVEVSVTESYSAVLTGQVEAGELDFAIVPREPVRESLRATYLGTDREVLVRRAGPGPAHLSPVDLADLPPLKLALPSRGNARREAIDTYLKIHGLPVSAVIDMDAMLATLDLVARSDWMTILPTTICFNDLDGTHRALHPLERPALTVDYVLIEPARRALPPSAALFLERLREHLREIDATWSGILGPHETRMALPGPYQEP